METTNNNNNKATEKQKYTVNYILYQLPNENDNKTIQLRMRKESSTNLDKDTYNDCFTILNEKNGNVTFVVLML